MFLLLLLLLLFSGFFCSFLDFSFCSYFCCSFIFLFLLFFLLLLFVFAGSVLIPRGIGKGEIPMQKKFWGFWLTHIIAMVISIYVFSFWGLRPRPPQGLCPWTPLGDFCPSSPCFVPSETNFWLRPCLIHQFCILELVLGSWIFT